MPSGSVLYRPGAEERLAEHKERVRGSLPRPVLPLDFQSAFVAPFLVPLHLQPRDVPSARAVRSVADAVADAASCDGDPAASAARGTVVLVLGSPGSGKTTLLAAYARQLCDPSGRTTPIPFWIPLGTDGVPKTLDAAVERCVGDSLADLVPALLLDGLDELPGVRDGGRPLESLRAVLHEVRRRPGAVAVVTCRSEELPRIRGGWGLRDQYPSYAILPPGATERRMLFEHAARARGQDPGSAADRLEHALMALPSGNVFQTPLLLSLFALYLLDESPDADSLSLYRVYDSAVRQILSQRLTEPDRLRALGFLAFVACRSQRRQDVAPHGGDAVIRRETLDECVVEYCAEAPDGSTVDGIMNILGVCGIFADQQSGVFVHRSFFEFFLAAGLRKELDRGEHETFSQAPLSDLTVELLAGQAALKDDALHRALGSTRGASFGQVRFRGGNAVTVLKRRGIPPKQLDLVGAVLAGADLRGDDLQRVDFGAADLSQADLSGARLDGADWTRLQVYGRPRIEERREIRSLAIDGDTVLFGNARGEVVVLDIPSLALRQRVDAHDHSVTAVCIEPTTGLLFSAGYDWRCLVWDRDSLEPCGVVPHFIPGCRALSAHAISDRACWLVAGSLSDELLAYRVVRPRAGDKRVNVEEPRRIPNVFGSAYRSMSRSADGTFLLVGGWEGNVHWFSVSAGGVRPAPIDVPRRGAVAVWGTTFAPDDSFAAVIDEDGLLSLWRATDGQYRIFLTQRALDDADVGRCVCLDEGAARVFIGTDEGTVYCFGRDGQQLEKLWKRRIHTDSVYALRLRAGAGLFSCGLDSAVVCVDPETGETRRAFSDVDSTRPTTFSVVGLKLRPGFLPPDEERYLVRRGAVLVAKSTSEVPVGPPDGADLYDKLKALLPTQLDEVILVAGAPSGHLPPATEPPARRALALTQWSSLSAENLRRIHEALSRAVGPRRQPR